MIDTNPEVFTVPLSAIIKEFSLEALYLPALPESILISNKHVNRLGLPFIGFYNHFEHTRIELIGNVIINAREDNSKNFFYSLAFVKERCYR